MVRQWQEFFYEKRYAATPLIGPDFVKLAEAFGIDGGDGRRSARDVGAGRASARARRSAPVGHRLPGRAGRLGVPDGAGRRRPAQDDSQAVADRRNRSGLTNAMHECTKHEADVEFVIRAS